ncbi:hypothetical protein CEE37_00485 [candidate division LCP-89 bacterium B3_LCP]|uniref:Secretion system C-terminal sorting domain-containing protein n=1 Tax=candidate division LCP-89 bacterium B3_LCP TaxID=2012998 RepID=A0A532V4U6_UNCL8|nr:MAG: hypothetical protein CEE37_00485 [candidate division LCP-89 bacterium B3_LCP]
MKRVFFLSIILLLYASSPQAITIYVPDDYATIGDAILAASDGDSILVGPGEYDQVPFTITGPDNITLLGNGYTGTDRTVVIGYGIVPGAKFELLSVENWEIGHFELMSSNKGVTPSECVDCYFHDLYIHDFSWSYADGFGVSDNSGILIERCVIDGAPFGGIYLWVTGNTGITIRNNTIVNCANGTLVGAPVPDLVLENNIIAFNGDGVEFLNYSWTGGEFLDYNDMFNPGNNWSGCTPGPNNISADPMFIGGTEAEQYMLLPNSPCIDAGNPASPPDPDGTVADIGCFYFDQNFVMGNLTVYAEPVEPPVVIPPEGGTFDYTASITCDTTNYAFFDAWVEFTLPNSVVVGPKFMRSDNLLAPGDSVGRDLSLHVSAFAMSGTYELTLLTGMYPDTIYVSDSFTFEKSGVDALSGGNEPAYAVLSGWDESEYIELPVNSVSVAQDISLGSHPNPFNPHTSLSFTLPASGRTSLKIFDLAGRTVATLLDREMQAGSHSMQFDGNQLASGVYLAVIEVGNMRAVERLLLLK